jgi:hypothetical protein
MTTVQLEEDHYDMRKDEFSMLSGETVDSIVEIPVLQALASNARLACCMLEAVRDLCVAPSAEEHPAEGDWSTRLDIGLSTIVAHAIQAHINKNGLKRLQPNERRHVAAWIHTA